SNAALESGPRMRCADIVESAAAIATESGADERGDRVARHRSHGRDRDRADGRAADQAAPERGQVGGAVGEAHVGAAADGQQGATATEAVEEPVSSLRVLGGLCVAGLNPEERPVKTRLGLPSEELAVQIDADLEAPVAG